MDVTVTVECGFLIQCFFYLIFLFGTSGCVFCLCRLGFSVIVYGLGSKKSLLEDFRVSHLAQEIHLVVNGFFPSITLKSVSVHRKMLLLVQCIFKQ